MASGVKVDSECVDSFNTFKLKKTSAFLIFGFNNDATKIVVLHKQSKSTPDSDTSLKNKNAPWDILINMLPNDDVRYAVADVHFNTPEGPRTEMVFVTWAPETAKIKRKMLMASSKDAIKNVLIGCKTTVQATCYPELDLRNVVEKLKGSLD